MEDDGRPETRNECNGTENVNNNTRYLVLIGGVYSCDKSTASVIFHVNMFLVPGKVVHERNSL